MRKYILSLFILFVISLSLFPSFKAQAIMGDYLLKWGAEFYVQFPVYIAGDGNGNIYVSDHANHRIQVYTATGKLLMEWGSFGSDNGQFNRPYGVAVDGNGNIYVVDSSNNRIQVFAPDGTFLRKWGSLWYAGLGGDGYGRFNSPFGVTVDGNGNVYVSDYGNHRIQVFTSDGTFIRAWGSQGTGDGQFDFPFGIAVNKISGDIYVADGFNHRIQVFAPDGTFLRKWGGLWHPGSSGDGHGKFFYPYGVTVDGNGNVFVVDTYNHRIQVFDSNGVFIMTWGSYGCDNGQFRCPYGVTVNGSGKVYVTDRSNGRIQIFASDGTFLTKWENYGSANGQLYSPFDLTLDKKSGEIFVADSSNHRIQVFDSERKFIKTWGSLGIADGQFKSPRGVGVNGTGNVFVVDRYNHRIQVFDPEGKFIKTWGSIGTADGQFNHPEGLAVDVSGNVFVADTYNHRIQVFDPEGKFIKTWGSFGTDDGQFKVPCGVAIDYISGDIYVTDACNYRIQVFDSEGEFIRAWGSEGNADGQFNFPSRVAVDKCGNVYVSDNINNQIQVFSSDGTFLGKWGNSGSSDGHFRYPSGIAVDGNYKVYVTDVLNYRIQVFKGAEDKIPPLAVCQDITVQLNDLGNANITATYVDSGSCDACGIASLAVSPSVFTCADVGANTVTLTVTDVSGNVSNCNAKVTVEDKILPVLGDITGPSDPVPINTTVDADVMFTEACLNTVIWNWGDDTMSSSTINKMNRLIIGSHAYNMPGVYELMVTLTDLGSNSDESIFQYVVVYDPDSGFVTGGGWIDSPEGAYLFEPSLTGKANFGFVSKYKKGAQTPTGQTEFHFKVANLHFHSESYQWLVVAGPNAKYKGTGTINGEGGYGFMLTAIDGDRPGGGGADKFRIKIWNSITDEVIYDNKIGENDDSYEATELGGGSIVIHK